MINKKLLASWFIHLGYADRILNRAEDPAISCGSETMMISAFSFKELGETVLLPFLLRIPNSRHPFKGIHDLINCFSIAEQFIPPTVYPSIKLYSEQPTTLGLS